MERVRHHAQRAERLTAPAAARLTSAGPPGARLTDAYPHAGAAEPPHARVLAEFAAAERAEGWLARCADVGCYAALSREFADALAAELQALGVGPGGAPALEVCAGDGTLAAALRRRGVPVVATDAAAPPHTAGLVERLTAAEALAWYAPRVVLGSFVPADAGVDARVLGSACAEAYVVLGARHWDGFGSAGLRAGAGWAAERLEDVTRLMVTRHDAWLGDGVLPMHRGEAWRFTRTPR